MRNQWLLLPFTRDRPSVVAVVAGPPRAERPHHLSVRAPKLRVAGGRDGHAHACSHSTCFALVPPLPTATTIVGCFKDVEGIRRHCKASCCSSRLGGNGHSEKAFRQSSAVAAMAAGAWEQRGPDQPLRTGGP